MASLAAMASGAGPVSSSCSDAQDGGVLNPPRCFGVGAAAAAPWAGSAAGCSMFHAPSNASPGRGGGPGWCNSSRPRGTHSAASAGSPPMSGAAALPPCSRTDATTSRHSTAQHSSAQHRAAQRSTARHGTSKARRRGARVAPNSPPPPSPHCLGSCWGAIDPTRRPPPLLPPLLLPPPFPSTPPSRRPCSSTPSLFPLSALTSDQTDADRRASHHIPGQSASHRSDGQLSEWPVTRRPSVWLVPPRLLAFRLSDRNDGSSAADHAGSSSVLLFSAGRAPAGLCCVKRESAIHAVAAPPVMYPTTRAL
ncbi:hypothetical protein Purlil1_6946 [Purpureocillium lilacinum]|uniref:Uncharacterized protein n=1 Tax=Purpureocillium lilacinum TaxID=33203 RepID=A0ABR0BXL6_PURLI|nr:hypothetical protein Purlil1_6946 [Purpureocillium lilacinum]